MIKFAKLAVDETIHGLRYRPLWLALAWEDLRQRYRRTLLGASWAVISFAIFCGVKIAIFSQFTARGTSNFSSYVILGFFAWQFIAAIITEGCSAFSSSRAYIRGSPLPITIYIFQAIARISYLSAYCGVAAIVLIVIVGQRFEISSLTVFPAVALYLLTAFPAVMILATFSTLFPDAEQLIKTAMRMIFFLTPIVWVPGQNAFLSKVAAYNPFTHYVAVMRTPIVEGFIPWDSWAIVTAVSLGLWIVALVAYGRSRDRIPFLI
jgi:ABC-type polysaccharide/polyol phosphate export permease